MELIQFKNQPSDSPLRIFFSLESQIKIFENYAHDEKHPFYESSKQVLEAVDKFPELREGIEDFNQLHKYEKEITLLFNPAFPDALQLNEIKSVMIPLNFKIFNLTQRFQNILKNAGPDYRLGIKDWDETNLYFFACSFILMKCYNKFIDASRPTFIDIPDQKSGITRCYRATFNADFIEITKTEKAPELTQKDIDELLLRGEDLEFWKSKFPPGSYILKGFIIMTMFDATNDVMLSKIRSVFLRNDENVFQDFQQYISEYMGIKKLKVGYSIYDTRVERSLGSFFNRGSKSIFLEEYEEVDYKDLFCDNVCDNVMQQSEIIAISDVELYGQMMGKDLFYEKLNKKGIKSLVLVPIKLSSGYTQLLELASTQKNELNPLNARKLEDIVPFVKIASERIYEERQNTLESTIQENYTSIHPTVKWRFTEAAANLNDQKAKGVENPPLESIVFNDVYPLYAQSDIKGSSTARNSAIQADLVLQLSLVIETFQKILEEQSFPIYQKLVYRVQTYLNSVEQGLKAGDEVSILDFLRREIYPVFDHLKSVKPSFAAAIKTYMSKIDPQLHVVYQERKSYEQSVNILNDKLAAYLDNKQEEAQKMFPHYYERYKTDGVEFNMYIGASLVQEEESFNLLYLHNLRLWQLETMVELEQVALDLAEELPYYLRVASLVLIHSNPLAIRFSMEQKSFDVDGAYNARYEIIKKRIDKSHIKGTDERLTQPGKIAIVYSQNKDAFEYINYLKYLQSKNLVGEIEMLDLEDLQGVSGLKAIRVEVLYESKKEKVMNGKKSLGEVKKKVVKVEKNG